MSKIIKDNNQLKNLINRFERANSKIIMVNGCFDLFHVGHLNLLKFAKNQGDILIVAINSDVSINGLKGFSRPIIAQNDRLSIISSLIYVDYAIIFNEENPSKLINTIRPYAIVKEEEYENKRISEMDAIEKHNVKLIFYKRDNNISTSLIIDRILSLKEYFRFTPYRAIDKNMTIDEINYEIAAYQKTCD